MADQKPTLVPEETYLTGGMTALQLSSQRNNRWSAKLPLDHGKDQILNPLYWRVFAAQMRVCDVIEVTDEAETFWGEYLVFEKGRDYVKLQELRHVELGTGTVSVDDQDYEYKWKGASKKHCVIRVSDGSVMVENCPSKEAAMTWIKVRKAA